MTVLSAYQAIDRVIDEIGQLDLPPGQKKDLVPGLQRAQQDIERGDYNSAVNELSTVQNKIAGWSGKKIAPGTAQALIQEIQRIMDALPIQPSSTRPSSKGKLK